jgi:hypothetical protein
MAKKRKDEPTWLTPKLVKTFEKFPKAFKRIEPSKLFVVAEEEFVEETSTIMEELIYRNKQGVIVTFDLRTREISDELKRRNVNVEKDAYFVDCISYASGQGTPPVFNCIALNHADEFENIFFYTIIQLAKIESDTTFVAIIAPYALLKYTDLNEIGVLFKWFKDQLNNIGIPIMFIYKQNEDQFLENVLSNLVQYKDNFA